MEHDAVEREWMLRGFGKQRRGPQAEPVTAGHAPVVGKRTLVEALPFDDAPAPRRAGTRADLPVPAAARPRAGAPLATGTRTWMERMFGCDFGEIRVHEGPEAGAVGAVAFAQGDDLHFAPGAYQPETDDGRALVAHELTHVVQQRRGAGGAVAQAKGAVNGDAGLEAEADRLGALAAAGQRVEVQGMASAASGVQRHTHYPTRHGDPNPPAWAIPNGPATQATANAIFGNLTAAGANAMKQPKTADGKRNDAAPRSAGYVVAVVLLDNGTTYATCSGTPPPAFVPAVIAAGATYLPVQNDKGDAKKMVKREARKQGQTVEAGETAGNCAAAKLVMKINEEKRGIPTQMSEILFSPNNSPALDIKDHAGQNVHYTNGTIVPSCEHCQAILGRLLPGLALRVQDHRALVQQIAAADALLAAAQVEQAKTRAAEAAHAQDEAQIELRAKLLAAVSARLTHLLANRKQLSLDQIYIDHVERVLDDGVSDWLELKTVEATDLANVDELADRAVLAAMEACDSAGYEEFLAERDNLEEQREERAAEEAAQRDQAKAKTADRKGKGGGKKTHK